MCLQCILWCGQLVQTTQCLFAAFAPDGLAFSDDVNGTVARARDCVVFGRMVGSTEPGVAAARVEHDLLFNPSGSAVWSFGDSAWSAEAVTTDPVTRCVQWRDMGRDNPLGFTVTVVSSLSRRSVKLAWRLANGSMNMVCVLAPASVSRR